MVLEIYPAWFDCEGIIPHQTLDPVVFGNAINALLALNSSVSIYPVFGGTKYVRTLNITVSFGFTNGAEHPSWIPLENYCADTTSYDYDAPISEPGDPTEKFMVLRDIIGRYGTPTFL